MQIQIHKSLAEVLQIKPDKDGLYFCNERLLVPVKLVEEAMSLNDINWKIKLEKLKSNGK